LLAPIALALLYTTTLALTQGINIGVDVYFHLRITESWASGHLGMFAPLVMQVNHSPYPPLFHFLLVPGIWMGLEIQWVTWVQVLFMPLAVASFMFLAYKLYGATLAFYAGFLVLGCTAYLDRVVQPQPQALDFILLPLAFYGFLFLKRKGYVVASVLMVWNHGLASLSALGGTLLGYLQRRDWKVIIAFLIGSSVILALTLVYLIPTLSHFQSATVNTQEWDFWHLPLFVPFYLGFLIIGFPIAIYRTFQWTTNRKYVSAIDKLSLLTIASTAIMIPIWADRWIQYASIPLALLLLSQVNSAGQKARMLWFMAIIFFYFANGTFALSIRLLIG
jgi:hypothetical protein